MMWLTLSRQGTDDSRIFLLFSQTVSHKHFGQLGFFIPRGQTQNLLLMTSSRQCKKTARVLCWVLARICDFYNWLIWHGNHLTSDKYRTLWRRYMSRETLYGLSLSQIGCRLTCSLMGVKNVTDLALSSLIGSSSYLGCPAIWEIEWCNFPWPLSKKSLHNCNSFENFTNVHTLGSAKQRAKML